jgi:hypothetical protein
MSSSNRASRLGTSYGLPLAVALVVLSAGARAQSAAIIPPSPASVNSPTSPLIVDFDNDGWSDVVVGTAYANSFTTSNVAIHRNLGGVGLPGSLSAGNFLPQGTQQPAAVIASHDVDGDGFRDLVTLTRHTTCVGSTLRLYINNGVTGPFSNFLPPVVQTFAYRAANAEFANVVATAGVELVLTDDCGGTVRILQYVGGATPFVQLQQVTVSAGPVRLAVADLDGNGLLDIVTGSALSISTAYQLTPGSFTVLTQGVAAANILEVADLDGNGLPDIVAASGTNTYTVLSQTAVGAFSAATTSLTGSSNWRGKLVDFNGDGFTDFVLLHYPNCCSSNVYVLNGTGGVPTFAPPVPVGGVLGNFLVDLAVDEMNGSPGVDFVRVGQTASSSIEVFGNNTPQATAPFPGTGSDYMLLTGVFGSGVSIPLNGHPQKTAAPGQFLSIGALSPGGTYVGMPVVIATQAFPTAAGPWAANSGYAGVHFGFPSLAQTPPMYVPKAGRPPEMSPGSSR